MKRFAWLILFAFCTALAQVQPVVVDQAQAEPCDCCEVPGACGMPDCAPPPAASQPVGAQTCCALAVGVTAEATAKSRPASKRFATAFSVPSELSLDGTPGPASSTPPPAAATVPLFTAHCSFLL